MPTGTEQAIIWALTETYFDGIDTVQVTKENSMAMVDKVRQYFNDQNISYNTFSYDDLKPLLN